jgi:hypothetical protein
MESNIGNYPMPPMLPAQDGLSEAHHYGVMNVSFLKEEQL